MLSVLPSVIILGLIAVASTLLANSRRSPIDHRTERLAAARALAIAMSAQSIHFVEEAAMGFHDRFGALFGLPGMSVSAFSTVNLVWIGIWMASYWGLKSGRPAAFFCRLVSRDRRHGQRYRASTDGPCGQWLLPRPGQLTFRRRCRYLALEAAATGHQPDAHRRPASIQVTGAAMWPRSACWRKTASLARPTTATDPY